MVDRASPVKRHRHERNRHTLKRLHKGSNMNTSGKSLFEDESNDRNGDEDDIFTFNNNTILNAGQSEGRSFLSLEPTKGTGVFDFNSYLKQITSEIKIDSRNTPSLAFTKGGSRSTLLNLEKGKKLDLIDDRSIITGDNLMDEWELDCIVRASEYDSHSEIRNLNEKDDADDFGINFSQLAESQERKSHDILNIDDDLSTPTSKLTNHLVPTSEFLFDPTLSLSKKSFSIFSDNLRSPESPSIRRTPSTPPPSSSRRYKKNVCSPHHRTLRSPVKSNFKPAIKNLLNLIVESSDGDIDEAVKFATEINSLTDLSIPIPQKTTELVNIPTNGPPDSSGHRKSAIISGVKPKFGRRKIDFTSSNDKENSNTKRFNHHLSQRRVMKESTNNTSIDLKRANGFYSSIEKVDFLLKKKEIKLGSSDLINDKKKERAGVKWADDLEW